MEGGMGSNLRVKTFLFQLTLDDNRWLVMLNNFTNGLNDDATHDTTDDGIISGCIYRDAKEGNTKHTCISSCKWGICRVLQAGK